MSGHKFNNVYHLIIDKVGDKKEPFDSRLSITVDSIITEFFENINNALIYVCSEEGSKAKKRFNTFNRWYKNSNYNVYVNKIDNTITAEENTVYMSVLYRRDNPNAEQILSALEDIRSALESDKE